MTYNFVVVGSAASSSNSAASPSSAPTSSRYSTKFSAMAAAAAVSPTNQRSATTRTASETVFHTLFLPVADVLQLPTFQSPAFDSFISGVQSLVPLSSLLLSTALFPNSSLYFCLPVSCYLRTSALQLLKTVLSGPKLPILRP
jgi:hypothetical protein